MLRSVRHALRRLWHSPVYSLVAIGSLALSIGITTAVYSIIYVLLWKPLPVSDPGRFAVLEAALDTSRPRWQNAISERDFRTLQESRTALISISASTASAETLSVGERRWTVQVECVAGSYFQTIGIRPASGRPLNQSDESADVLPVVVSYRFWSEALGRSGDIVGDEIKISGRIATIVGVAGRGFDGVIDRGGSPTAAWIPRTFVRKTAVAPADETLPTLTVFGRLPSKNAREAATVQVQAIGSQLDRAFPIAREGDNRATPRNWTVRTAQDLTPAPEAVSSYGTAIVVVILLVVLVACTNLANLTMARAVVRRNDVAIRRMLGATRAALMQEQLVESVILAGVGGTASLVVSRLVFAFWEVDLNFGKVDWTRIGVETNWPSVIFAGLVTLVCFGVFGLMTAARQTRLGQSEARVTSESRIHWMLIRWQVVVSISLFLIAAACISAVVEESRHDSGIDIDHLAVVSFDVSSQAATDHGVEDAVDRIKQEVSLQGGVRRVSLSLGLPFGVPAPLAFIRPLNGARQQNEHVLVEATPEAFETLGIPVLAGRPFDSRDGNNAIVLSRRAAETLFGTLNAVGRVVSVQIPGDKEASTRGVIGIVGDTDVVRFFSRRGSAVYTPLARPLPTSLVIAARVSSDPRVVAQEIRRLVSSADPTLQIKTAGAAVDTITGAFVLIRLAAFMVSVLGVLALVLASIGLYGVLSVAVTERTKEIGVRMALGATAGRVEMLITREGLRPVVQGFLIAIALGSLARALLRIAVSMPVATFDGFAIGAAIVPLAVAGAISCYLPARRAARVDPKVALRQL